MVGTTKWSPEQITFVCRMKGEGASPSQIAPFVNNSWNSKNANASSVRYVLNTYYKQYQEALGKGEDPGAKGYQYATAQKSREDAEAAALRASSSFRSTSISSTPGAGYFDNTSSNGSASTMSYVQPFNNNNYGASNQYSGMAQQSRQAAEAFASRTPPSYGSSPVFSMPDTGTLEAFEAYKRMVEMNNRNGPGGTQQYNQAQPSRQATGAFASRTPPSYGSSPVFSMPDTGTLEAFEAYKRMVEINNRNSLGGTQQYNQAQPSRQDVGAAASRPPPSTCSPPTTPTPNTTGSDDNDYGSLISELEEFNKNYEETQALFGSSINPVGLNEDGVYTFGAETSLGGQQETLFGAQPTMRTQQNTVFGAQSAMGTQNGTVFVAQPTMGTQQEEILSAGPTYDAKQSRIEELEGQVRTHEATIEELKRQLDAMTQAKEDVENEARIAHDMYMEFENEAAENTSDMTAEVPSTDTVMGGEDDDMEARIAHDMYTEFENEAAEAPPAMTAEVPSTDTLMGGEDDDMEARIAHDMYTEFENEAAEAPPAMTAEVPSADAVMGGEYNNVDIDDLIAKALEEFLNAEKESEENESEEE